MNRKVKYARLQTEAHAPGAMGLGTVFPPQGKTLQNLDMFAGSAGLLLSFTYNGFRKELLIPYANVAVLDLAPEEAKEESIKKSKEAK